MKVYGALESATLEIMTNAQETAASKYEGRILYNSEGKEIKLCNGTAAESLVPVGVVQDFAGSSAPTGWLLCDGSAISRTTYAKLFAVVSTTYGAGDGSTTFNLPDAQGRMTIGAGSGSGLTARSLGDTGGSETDSIPAHNHQWMDYDPNHDGVADRNATFNSSGTKIDIPTDTTSHWDTGDVLFTGIGKNTTGSDSQISLIVNDSYTDNEAAQSVDTVSPFLCFNKIIKY